MNDVAYWHRKTVDELFQARSDLHKVRTEFGRVSTALNEAVAEANRWQDAYEHATDTPGPDTIRGWQHRIDQAENRASDAEQRAEDAEQRVREHSEEIDQLVARVVAAEQRAELAEANARDYLDRATRAEEDRNRMEAHARGWKTEAEKHRRTEGSS